MSLTPINLLPLIGVTATLGVITTTITVQAQELDPAQTQLERDGWDVTITRLTFTNFPTE